MFSKSKRINLNRSDISNYIEGEDIYNSKLLDIISQGDFSRETYVIQENEYRPDLISLDYYGSTRYFGLFLLTCGAEFDDFTIGTELHLIPRDTLDTIIMNLL